MVLRAGCPATTLRNNIFYKGYNVRVFLAILALAEIPYENQIKIFGMSDSLLKYRENKGRFWRSAIFHIKHRYYEKSKIVLNC